ncbi:MAG: PaaI family thioesterase [Rhodobacter sp.]|nr:PaaI family thioesterase [Paracoccaceae bacterium]MCB1410517.1 PaaI family thioesterase [Paracoccaceae bacterium]MCC0079591.1 PaaI family thioesterase [Rhodobacter sp.]
MTDPSPAQRFIDAIPHARALGLQLQEIADGKAVMTMPYAEALIGDPATGVIAGGAVSALMDTCCGAAVMSYPGARGTATLDLRIDYMRAAKPGQRIIARAECFHASRTVAFVRATAHDEDEGLPVATASGAFTMESTTAKPEGKA